MPKSARRPFRNCSDTLGSTGPDYTDEPTTERHRYIALLQYADELDQELFQRGKLNTSEHGASAGATIRAHVSPQRVATMSTVELQRLNDQIEDQLIQRRNFFIRPSDQAPPDELTELEENLQGWPWENSPICTTCSGWKVWTIPEGYYFVTDDENLWVVATKVKTNIHPLGMY